MKEVAALLLCVLGGNATPTVDDVGKVISAVGAEADADQVALMLKELDGKSIDEVVAAGTKKLATVSLGGGSGGGGSAAAAAGSAAAAAPEAKKEEPEEEEEVDMAGGESRRQIQPALLLKNLPHRCACLSSVFGRLLAYRPTRACARLFTVARASPTLRACCLCEALMAVNPVSPEVMLSPWLWLLPRFTSLLFCLERGFCAAPAV
ncbi:unnamed protein product [Phaeothamnion confervicola]